MSHILYKPQETHKSLYKKISKWRDSGITYDRIGEMLLPDRPASAKGVVWRAHTKNQWPSDNGTRMTLSLPIYKVIQDIPGTVHQVPENMVRKTKPAPRGQPRNRRAVNLDDPVSGAATLRKHASPAYLRRLVQELEND